MASFIVRNIYDCSEYHDDISDEFQHLEMPQGISGDLAEQVRPYFSVLMEDAKPAERVRQVLVPLKGLKSAMGTLEALFPRQLRGWDDASNLTYPYLQLWHCKDRVRAAVLDLPDIMQQLYANALLDYLEEEVTAECKEAEDLFDKGFVNKKHWAKLFRPNGLVITVEDGEPRAYVSNDCPTVADDWLSIDCSLWGFNGEFYQKNSTKEEDWPSKSDTISISDLTFYPLRFDKTCLEERLRSRGNIFWACRHRRYVNYNVSLDDTTDQLVGSLTSYVRIIN